MELIVRPHIMSDRNRSMREIDYGWTVQELVDSLDEIDPKVRELNLIVMIDGHVIHKSQWVHRRLERTDGNVTVSAMLHGGRGGQGKQIMALIASIALMVVAPMLAPALVTGLGGMGIVVSAAVAKAGIILVGTLIINAIFAPPRANNKTDEISSAYTFTNQNNQARPFGSVMRIYGKHRVRPDLAAVPYTMMHGDDSYFYGMYCFGYGPLKLEDFRIGQNPLTNYHDYEIKVHENFTDSNQLTIYKNDVWQDSFSIEVTDILPATITTRPATDRVIIDIVFPTGLGFANDDGETEERESIMTFGYRPQGSVGSFTPCNLVSVSRGQRTANSIGVLQAGDIERIQYDDTGGTPYYVKGFPAGTSSFEIAELSAGAPVIGSELQIGPYTMVVAAGTNTATLVTTTGLPGEIVASDGGNVQFTYSGALSPTGSGTWQFRAARPVGFNAAVEILFPAAGHYEIKVSKTDGFFDTSVPPAADTRILHKRLIGAMKSFKTGVAPMNPEVPLTIVELKIKATGQLNGTVEELSATATSLLKQWNGSSWVVAETRNPAWIYMDILQGTANKRPLADSRVDIEGIKAWAVKNDAVTAPFTQPLGTCDIVIDRGYTLWELLQSIATTGRATPTVKDNKYGVLIDDATRTPVQMFTPRNSSNLKSSRTYIQEPHALRVKWVDPEANYGPAEILVYNDGQNENNSTVFEELNSFGMTRPEQVTRWGRYMLAQGKLRQERFSIDTDIENIVCVRGDLVLVAHDVLQVGGEACRIDEIDGQTIYTDAPLSIGGVDTATDGVRIRMDTGLMTAPLAVSAVGGDYVTLAAPVPAGVKVGDLLAYGALTTVTGQYVVDYIRPSNDMAATIGLEEYAPLVYAAESNGAIPPYVPQGGSIYRPAAPTAFTSDLQTFLDPTGIFPYATINLTWLPPQGVPFQAEEYRLWSVNPDGTELYLGATPGLSWTDGPYSLWLEAGRTINYRVRAFYGTRGTSPPTDVLQVLPIIGTTPPKNVDTFVVTDIGNGLRRYTLGFTDGIIPPGVVGVDIRYITGSVPAPDFNAMTPVLIFQQTGLELTVPEVLGIHTFAAKTLDERGVLATTAKIWEVNLTSGSYDATPDLTPPPTPTGLYASATGLAVTVGVDTPTYTEGHGHFYTNIYYAEYFGTGPLPVFADAVFVGSFLEFEGTVVSKPDAQFHVWATWVSKDMVESLVPAGGTNGIQVNTTNGGAVPDLTVPPTPTGLFFSAEGIVISGGTAAPTFTEGHGYERTSIYYATYGGVGPLPVFADAVLLSSSFAHQGSIAASPDKQFHIWATWTSKDEVESLPAGGLNGFTVTTGEAVIPDYTPPPTPTGMYFDVEGIVITGGTDEPTYTQGHGHRATSVYYTEYLGGVQPTFASAVLLSSSYASQGSIATKENAEFRIWTTWTSNDGVESAPAGGLNGYAVTTGGVTVPDLTPPPTPTGVVLEAEMTYIRTTHALPTYLQGHGHNKTVVWAAAGYAAGVATMNLSTDVVTFPSAPIAGMVVSFTTTGALPTGVITGDSYYVRDVIGLTGKLAISSGGAAINLSGSQSGVHTASLKPVRSMATETREFTGVQGGVEVPAGSKWHAWVYWESNDGVQSTTPAGGITGYSATAASVSEELEVDQSVPPTPTGFTASAGLLAVYATTAVPTFTEGRGYDHTDIYGVIYTGGALPTFGSATLLGNFIGSTGSLALEPGTTYRLWAKWVTMNGVESAAAGGTNGIAVVTGVDVTGLLTALQGELTASQLNAALTSRIDLIDGPIVLPGSVNARVDAEATTRITADSALASMTTALRAQVGEYESSHTWDFNTGDDGFTVTGATLTAGSIANGGILTLDSSGTVPTLLSPSNLVISGGLYTRVRMRVRRMNGSGWVGSLRYVTPGHALSNSFMETVSNPPLDFGIWEIIEWDMSSVTAGGTDWITNYITQLEFKLGAGSTDDFEIDWISVSRSQYDVGRDWDFDASVESWSAGSGATVSWQPTPGAPGALRIAASASASSAVSGAISVLGSMFTRVRMRIKRNAGSGWTGRVTYSTAGHVASASYQKILGNPALAIGATAVLEWDMATLTSGAPLTDWLDSIITSIKLELGSSATDSFDIDWIALVPELAGGVLRAVAVTRTTVSANKATQNAIAQRIDQFSVSSPGAGSSTIEQAIGVETVRTDGLLTKYTVKIDSNGFVSGFGLASVANNGTVVSTFNIRADSFYIASPTGGGIGPQQAFIFRSTPIGMNGQTIPAGMYVNDAFIQNGTIVTAKIGNAQVDSLTVAGNAISVAASASFSTDTTLNSATVFTLSSIAHTAGALVAPAIIWTNFGVAFEPVAAPTGTSAVVKLSLARSTNGGADVELINFQYVVMDNVFDLISLAWGDSSVVAGNVYTYKMKVQKMSGATVLVTGGTMFGIGTKR